MVSYKRKIAKNLFGFYFYKTSKPLTKNYNILEMASCVIEETESSVTSTFVTPTFARWFNPTQFYLLRIGDVSGF